MAKRNPAGAGGKQKPQRPDRRAAEAQSRTADRKEKVLHTRVSEQLAEDIYRAAEDLRVPVSNLVRNVLQDVFSVVETVTDNVGSLIEDVIDRADRTHEQLRERAEQLGRVRRRRSPADRQGEQRRARADAVAGKSFPAVIGWQPMILNQNQRCAKCGQQLVRGHRAVIGLTASGLSRTYLCRRCARR